MFGFTDHVKHNHTPAVKPIRIRRATRPQRLILMGTGPFAVPAFGALCEAGHEVALVVTRPAITNRSRKGPPPSPVRDFAERHGFSLFDPESINTPASVARLSEERAALLVVCDYGQILSSDALSTAPLGGINLHGSLLPAYRGAAPVQWAVLNGDEFAGVSIIHMTPKLDGGPILAIAKIPIEPRDTSGTLEAKLATLGIEPTLASVELLAQWNGVEVIGKPQDKSLVSRAPRLSKPSGQIDWNRSAAEIDRHIRGMQPWPGAFTDVTIGPDREPLRIAVRTATIELGLVVPPSATPGLLLDDRSLRIATGPVSSPGIIRIDRLQPAGRNEVTAEEFIRGHRIRSGAKFGSQIQP